jgi:hypothetical protein
MAEQHLERTGHSVAELSSCETPDAIVISWVQVATLKPRIMIAKSALAVQN